MATNDLMMKIQLLVESGKSTAELDRLSKSLKQLTSELKSLENTKITPLTRDLQEIKKVAQTLRNVNISNFGKSLDSIKQSMIGLGVGTSNLDKLRESYQKLNEQLKSPIAKTLVSDIQSSQKNISDLRTNEIIPLQNDIRRLQATKGLNKVLRMDNLSASLRVAKAELANVSNEISKLLKLRAESSKKDSGVIFTDKDQQSLSNLRADYKRLNDEIIKGNLDLAKTNQDIVKQYNGQIALKQRELVTSKNILTSETNRLKNLQSQLKAETDKEKSIQRQITYYSKLTTSDALAKSLELQQQLAQSKTKQVGLKKDITDTESLTKAELARIQAMEKANTTAMKKANAEIKNQSGNLTTLGRLFGKSGGAVREFGDAIFFAFGPQMAGFIAAAGIANAVREVTVAFFEANKSVENLLRGLNAISGGQGVVLFNQLVDSANRLGIPLKQVSQSFLEVQAATTGTNFEGQKTKNLFDALANALTLTGADAVTFNRGFRAMAQILSKDQLYAEELRQQLGEALPGAVQVFARALNISPKELLSFVEAGVIEGDNLRRTLVLVTKELERTYKVANEQDFTFTQKAALAQNALHLLFVEIGNTGVWKAFGNALLFARDTFVSLRESVTVLSDAFRNEFNIISAIVSSGLEETKKQFESIDPTFNFESLKKQLSGIPSTIVENINTGLRDIKGFLDEIDLIIKNFKDRQSADNKPWLTIGISDERLFAALKELDKYLPGEKIKELGTIIRTQIIDNLKTISSTPIKIKTEVKTDSFEEFKQKFLEFNRFNRVETGIEFNDSQIRQYYNEYLADTELLNQKIREQNQLNQRVNQQLQENVDLAKQRASIRVKAEEEARLQEIITKDIRESSKFEQQRIGFHKAYIEQLEAGEKRGIELSKQRSKIEKQLLDIRNEYNNALLQINSSKYQRWAEQGQITEEAATFLAQVEKARLMRQAVEEAITAVDRFNQEADRGKKANQSVLDLLQQQADDQLKYAAQKAIEAGDEQKIKKIMELREGILQRQLKLAEDFNKKLEEAEKAKIVPTLKPIEDNTVSSFVSTVQEQIARQPQPMITVGLKLGQSELTPLLPYNLSSVETKARGGLIPGGYSNRDSVHALLAPGEFVIPSNIVKALSPSFFYDLIRSRGLKIPQVNARENITIPHFAAGGLVQQSAQPIIINAAGKQIHLSGSREAANQLAKLLTQTGRAL